MHPDDDTEIAKKATQQIQANYIITGTQITETVEYMRVLFFIVVAFVLFSILLSVFYSVLNSWN